MVTSLKPIDIQLWRQYDDLFLDLQPLSAEATDVLLRALEAQQPQGDSFYLKGEWTARVEPEPKALDDPYHVPLHIQFPPRLHHEQRFVSSGSQAVKYQQTITLPDGTLYAGQSNNGSYITSYEVRSGMAHRHALGSENWRFVPPQMPTDQIIKHFFSSAAPVNIQRLDGAIQLIQIQRSNVQPEIDSMMAVELDAFVGSLSPWLGELTSGSYIYRVWLNDTTLLPMRAETVFVDQDGRETELTSFVLREWQPQAALPADPFNMPPLPPDTIVFDSEATPSFRTADGPDGLFDMERALVWKEVAGLTQVSDSNPQNADGDQIPGFDSRFGQALGTPLQQLDHLGVIKMTTYRMPDASNRIIVRQGPRSLLRHVLRHNPLSQYHERGQIWASSIPISVEIDGKQRTAWLLEESYNIQSLVVEVDDVLLHISGLDRDYLQQRLPSLLPLLTWEQIEN